MEYDTKIRFCLFNCAVSSDKTGSFTCHGISFYRGNRLSSVTHVTIMIIVFWNVTQCGLREGTNVRRHLLSPSSLVIPEDEGSMFIQSADKYIYRTARRHIPQDINLHNHYRKNIKFHIFIVVFKNSNKILSNRPRLSPSKSLPTLHLCMLFDDS
jgi:hypothetical protein